MVNDTLNFGKRYQDDLRVIFDQCTEVENGHFCPVFSRIALHRKWNLLFYHFGA